MVIDQRPYIGDVLRWFFSRRRQRADQAAQIAALRKEIGELRAELARLSAVRPVQPESPAVSESDSAVKAAAGKVLDHVRSSGGVLAKSERGLAQLIRAPKSTTRRAIHLLVAAGTLALEASRQGSVLRLIG